jgi:hypothetical protein
VEDEEKSIMAISSISNTSPAQLVPPVNKQSATGKSQRSPDSPTDTITLSPAAQEKLKSGDVDQDGDSR